MFVSCPFCVISKSIQIGGNIYSYKMDEDYNRLSKPVL